MLNQKTINLTQMNDEFIRITFESVVSNLNEQEMKAQVIEHPQGEIVMLVPILGPEDMNAEFRMLSSQDGWEMQAIYISSVLPAGYMDSWNLGQSPDIDSLAKEIIPDFIYRCFMKEHEQFCQITLIVDENKMDYIHLLPDEALTRGDVFAAGVIVDEEGGPVPAGVVTFTFEDMENMKNANIEYIFVDENYRDIGIATYMVNAVADLLEE